MPTQKGSNADPYVTGIALPNVPLGNYDVPSGWPTNVKFNEPGDVPGPPVQFESDEMGDPGAGYGFESDRTYEGDWFFFHTDHLGSTSYLTDTAGNVSQFVCYTPYGEAIVDEHLTTYENPFKFSGKELDDITGLYDHGARSRNPISTLWYGVDPRYEEFPEMSPFAYCHGNPVKFVDLDGRDRYIFNEDGTFARVIYKEEGEHYGYIEGKNIKFKFADPVNDPKFVESKKFVGLQFISDEEIDNALWNSGVQDFHLCSTYYAYKQSTSGKMDYTFTANFKRGKEQLCDIEKAIDYQGGISEYNLHITYTKDEGYIAHNNYNFGNFLWGAGMNNLGFNLELTVEAAHYNNYYHDIKRGVLDSPDDQFSIKCGYKWGDEHSSCSWIKYFFTGSNAEMQFNMGQKISKKLWGK